MSRKKTRSADDNDDDEYDTEVMMKNMLSTTRAI